MLLASLMLRLPPPPLPPWYQGAVPVSDVADAVAVAVAVAREVRSGRRRRGCVDDVCEAGEMGRREMWEVVSSYLMVWSLGEVMGPGEVEVGVGWSTLRCSGTVREVVVPLPVYKPLMRDIA